MNVSYHSALFRGHIVRSLYSKLLPVLAKRPIQQEKRLPVSVYSFSCQRDLPEQVACIRSFIRYAGVPDKFVVVSDGTYTQNDVNLLCSIDTCVQVMSYEQVVMRNLHPAVETFAQISPYGKKLAVAMSLPTNTAAIMTDADVLFFRGAGALADLVADPKIDAWYLLDAQPALDDRMICSPSERANPVNCGFLLLKAPLDWTAALQRLAQLKETPIPFTEQTVIHFAMHESKAKPLEQRKFVMELDDQVHFTDWYAHKDIALRHYVNPVRHKMWSRLHI